MEGIGDRIKSVRLGLHLSQKDFGIETGCALKTIARYEKEDNLPDLGFIYRLIDQYAVNPNWLLTGNGSMTQYTDQEFAVIDSILSDSDLKFVFDRVQSDPIFKTVLLSIFKAGNDEAEIERQLNILRAGLKK